jgi:hypothetical protein
MAVGGHGGTYDTLFPKAEILSMFIECFGESQGGMNQQSLDLFKGRIRRRIVVDQGIWGRE